MLDEYCFLLGNAVESDKIQRHFGETALISRIQGFLTPSFASYFQFSSLFSVTT
jgi:hypothetical protein